MKTKMIKSEHHRGKKVPLVLVLSSLAAQEGCDGFECDMMDEAADYIIFLENRINEMEERINKLEKKKRNKLNKPIGLFR